MVPWQHVSSHAQSWQQHTECTPLPGYPHTVGFFHHTHVSVPVPGCGPTVPLFVLSAKLVCTTRASASSPPPPVLNQAHHYPDWELQGLKIFTQQLSETLQATAGAAQGLLFQPCPGKGSTQGFCGGVESRQAALFTHQQNEEAVYPQPVTSTWSG